MVSRGRSELPQRPAASKHSSLMAFSNETLRTESDVLLFHADRFACVMSEGAVVDLISISRGDGVSCRKQLHTKHR